MISGVDKNIPKQTLNCSGNQSPKQTQNSTNYQRAESKDGMN